MLRVAREPHCSIFLLERRHYVLILALETSTFDSPRDKAMYDVHGYAISAPFRMVALHFAARQDECYRMEMVEVA